MKRDAADVRAIFESVPGLAGKVVYRVWKADEEQAVPDMPYLAFYPPRSVSFFADNVTYHLRDHYTAELYSVAVLPALESGVEAALTAAGIAFSKTKDFIEAQNCWAVTYDFEVN